MSARVLRTAVTASLALSLAGAGGALAGPKTSCDLIKDDTGDAAIVSDQASLDIVTADLASDDKNITAVLRLDGAPSGANPEAVGGTRYYLSFNSPGVAEAQYLAAFVPFAGDPTFRTGQITDNGTSRSFSTDPDPATGKIEENVVTITAPLSAFSERAKVAPGTKLAAPTAETFAVVGVFLVSVDDATGKSYTAGNPSCVKPGA